MDIIIPLSSFDKTDKTAIDETTIGSIDWLYNMKSRYTTGFDPNIQLRVNGKMDTGEYLAIENIKFLWYEEEPVDYISVSGVKTQYYKNSAFDTETGEITIHYKDGKTRKAKLKEAIVSGFDSSNIVSGQKITVTYAGKKATYNIDVVYDQNLIYTNQQFENIEGEVIPSFEGENGVIAKITVENPDPVIKQPNGVLFAVTYKRERINQIKNFNIQQIPQGVSELTAEFIKEELKDATKIKIIALKDSESYEPIFSEALEIFK